MKVCYLFFPLLIALLLTACGGGNTSINANYNTQSDKYGEKATVKFGRLADATVEIYEIQRDGTLKKRWTEHTSAKGNLEDIGTFTSHIKELDSNRYYIYKVTGGKSWDADENGIKDDQPTPNRGIIRAIAKGSQFKRAGKDLTITVISELLYEKVAKYVKYYNDYQIDQTFTKQIPYIIEDLNGDGIADIIDILTYDPEDEKDKVIDIYRYRMNHMVDMTLKNKRLLLNLDTTLGQFDAGENINKIFRANDSNHIYTSSDRSLFLVDISNPTKLKKSKKLSISKPIRDIAFSKDKTEAYIINDDGLTIVDTLSFSKKVEYSLNSARLNKIIVADNAAKAYIVTDTGFTVVDIHNPLAPVIRKNVVVKNDIQKFILSEDETKAYTTRYWDNLISIIDLKNPNYPVIKTIKIDGKVKDFVLSSNEKRVYIINENYQNNTVFDIFNISELNNPHREGKVNLDAQAENIVLSSDGNTAFLRSDKGLININIKNPLNPSVKGIMHFTEGIDNIALSSDPSKVYIASERGAIKVIDVSIWRENNNPAIISALKPSPVLDIRDIAISTDRGIACIANGTSGFIVLTIKDPLNPMIEGTLDGLAQSYDSLSEVNSVALSADGKKAYLADSRDGLVIIDISTPEKPKIVSNVYGQGEAYKIALSSKKKIAYIADDEDLLIVDISNTSKPTIMSTVQMDGIIDVILSDDNSKAYIYDYNGLVAINVENPFTPFISPDHITIPMHSDVTAIVDTNKIITSSDDNLAIVDMNKRSIVSHLKMPGWITDVALSQDRKRAYIANAGNGLVIADIQNPLNPTIQRTFLTASWITGVTLSKDEKIAYIVDDVEGLKIIDLGIFD